MQHASKARGSLGWFNLGWAYLWALKIRTYTSSLKGWVRWPLLIWVLGLTPFCMVCQKSPSCLLSDHMFSIFPTENSYNSSSPPGNIFWKSRRNCQGIGHFLERVSVQKLGLYYYGGLHQQERKCGDNQAHTRGLRKAKFRGDTELSL